MARSYTRMRTGWLRRRLSVGILLAVLAFSTPAAAADRFTGNVIGVSDGDTITVLRDRAPVSIRLDGVDCPESGQDFGQRAKQFTSGLLFGKTVAVDVRDIDRYGRLVARVRVDGQDVSLALVNAGFAWHYKQYSGDSELAHAEVAARARRAGLWSQPRPLPPWEFRHPIATALNDAATIGPFHGNVRSGVFHRPGCQHYGCANCTRVFQTREAAAAAGFRPAGDCLR
jgi:endonuclease YncB( thermonuclease family)